MRCTVHGWQVLRLHLLIGKVLSNVTVVTDSYTCALRASQ
jgi:hypothetical protein